MFLSLNQKIRIKSCSRLTHDETFAKCLSYYWICSILNAVLKRIIGGDENAAILSALICAPLFFFWGVKSFLLLKYTRRLYIFFYPCLLYIALFAISLLNGTPFSPMPLIIMWGILGLFLGSIVVSISDHTILYKVFKQKLPAFLLVAAPAGFATSISGDYMMHYSFMLVFPCCICWHAIIKERQKSYIFIFLGFLSLITLYGSRGPLLVVFIFIILYTFFKGKQAIPKLGFLLGGMAVYINLNSILNFIYYTLESFNIHSRTIELLTNDITHDSGRIDLYNQAQKLVDMKPLTGWGVAGERIYMSVYPHNIIYEFFLDFGKPLGVIILIILSLLLIRAFIKYKRTSSFVFISFFSSSCALFWSGSYLMNVDFWILIYLSIYVNKYKSSVPKETRKAAA